MSKYNINELIDLDPVVKDLAEAKETVWENPHLAPFSESSGDLDLTAADLEDAVQRLDRFAPFIMKSFPETVPQQGIIESPLVPIPQMQQLLEEQTGENIPGRLLLKKDSHLAVAGSIKARGGIYEILKHSEDLALEHGMLREGESYEVFASDKFREFFSQYSVHAGSTGNLGLSIGIISAALGYRVTIHMSADAKQWKKDLLRSRGVEVIEYQSDYSKAVEEGRRQAEQDPSAYFVDDENSKPLFLGYAAAAVRLAKQLKEQNILVDEAHPLIVFIPCGVGSAPGGLTFGLKHVFGDHVYSFFAEPVQAPCMVLGMSTGLHHRISVRDIGLSGLTHADGLAVGRASMFVGQSVRRMVSGIVTVDDVRLFDSMRDLLRTEDIFIEPSSCAAFQGPVRLTSMQTFLQREHLTGERLRNATQIVWATGGSIVPEEEREKYIHTHL